MKTTKLTVLLLGGLIAAGAALAYRAIAGKNYRKRTTAPKSELSEEEEQAAAVQATYMLLEEEDDEGCEDPHDN